MEMNMNVQEENQLHAGTTEESAIFQTPGRNWLRVSGIFFIFSGIYGFITLINICNNMMYDGSLNISIGDSYYAQYPCYL